ncbi:skin secretory protein xP2-like [Camelus ferus]|uniref:Skin secretory protein xP2-like n=1 Tax=Camelus ferus TaxID=419612 RepID=A0A8B8TPD6_CAMFR|nr:skin secretory protein xP2-like [Camelus ferus]
MGGFPNYKGVRSVGGRREARAPARSGPAGRGRLRESGRGAGSAAARAPRRLPHPSPERPSGGGTALGLWEGWGETRAPGCSPRPLPWPPGPALLAAQRTARPPSPAGTRGGSRRKPRPSHAQPPPPALTSGAQPAQPAVGPVPAEASRYFRAPELAGRRTCPRRPVPSKEAGWSPKCR